MIEEAKKILFGLSLVFIAVALELGAAYLACHSKADAMGLACEYKPLSGCLVTVNGHKVPLRSIRTNIGGQNG